jgi:hypothetical protein
MEATRRWIVGGLGACALGFLWVPACSSQASSGVGGESHFACAADSDCTQRPDQVCFFSNPGSAKGECTDVSAILDAARRSAGGAGNGGNGAGGKVDVDATVGGGPQSGQYCNGPRAGWPDSPAGVPPSTQNVEFAAAMYTVDLGDERPSGIEPTHYLELGFDLDATCTQAVDPTKGTCRLPAYGLGIIDGKGGIDNALGRLFQTVRNQISDFNSDQYTKTIQAGKTNLLLRLENWNGAADDNAVIVSALTAAPFDSFAAGSKPQWEGSDAWPIASDSVDGSVNQPKFVDRNAYVTQNQLVGTFAELDLRLDIGLSSVQDVKLDLKLSSAVVVCTIAPTSMGMSGYTFSKCTLGGRWLVNDFVQQLGQYPNPLDNNRPLCGGNVYDTFKMGICSQVDLNQTPAASPTAPCNALSVGLTFTTKPALLGDLYALKPIVDPCPPDPHLNPRYDCCESIGVPDAGKLPACGFTGPIGTGGNSGTGGAPGTGGRSPISDASTD